MANRNTARKVEAVANETTATDRPTVVPTTATALKLEGSAEHGKMRPRPTIFDKVRESVSSEAAEKIMLATTARQRLAEAFDLFQAGFGNNTEATSIAQEAALALYQGRAKGLLSPDEVSSILGDQFGFKTKKDGKPSKTPEGQGEQIRKRIVRLADAYAFAYQDEDKAFFKDLPADDVKGVLREVDEGLSPYSAYDKFAEMKREMMVRTDPAFDPKRVMKLAESLANEGTAEIFARSPDLVRAYDTLRSVLQTIGEAAAELAE